MASSPPPTEPDSPRPLSVTAVINHKPTSPTSPPSPAPESTSSSPSTVIHDPPGSIHIFGIFGPRDTSSLSFRYWSYIYRCDTPSSHVDAVSITQTPLFRFMKRVLNDSGKECMDYREWRGLVADLILAGKGYRRYITWRNVLLKRIEWIEAFGWPIVRVHALKGESEDAAAEGNHSASRIFSKSNNTSGNEKTRRRLRKEQKLPAPLPSALAPPKPTPDLLPNPTESAHPPTPREIPESPTQSFHTATPPTTRRPHKHGAFHNLRLGQWEYQLCKCANPESHGDAWEADIGATFRDKSGAFITWMELCERVLQWAGKESVTRQEYIQCLPHVLERGAADKELKEEHQADLVVALGGTICVDGRARWYNAQARRKADFERGSQQISWRSIL
ncbi:hypothetical protein K458DRAFT_405298 [Lentithecium fluviatile CBS 122367]|uniref:Uncharacterized protein n=1 Tax=Lentithecium fluviatile CBS 122367 TaxID=1168545 RepID=A0A6G1IYJ2_9PLEO|nr:hypothetical protein K458DRAFT_405298 [Lentithecium fluviatile CBS 122367]